MLHVRGCHKQKYSEACRALLGNKVDGLPGKLIDLLALFALLAGTTTTFALATPLMSQVLDPVPSSVLEMDHDRDPGRHLRLLYIRPAARHERDLPCSQSPACTSSSPCSPMYCSSAERHAISWRPVLPQSETSHRISFSLATFTDPQRTTSFPQNWTIFYWAYWMVWCVASPFFIGSISRGKNGAADDPRRICLQRQRYILKLYHFRKLQSRTSGKRKVRCYGDLCRRQRSLHNDHRHHPDTAACTVCPCAFNRCHGGLLCYQL